MGGKAILYHLKMSWSSAALKMTIVNMIVVELYHFLNHYYAKYRRKVIGMIIAYS